MSDQTQKDREKEAIRKRREYLLTKARANANTGLGAIATFTLGGVFVFCFYAAFLVLAFAPPFAVGILLAGFAVLLILLGAAVCLARIYWRSAAEEANCLPYVPPVREQIAALPAEEVLLRVSDQPSATPEELLRAAQAGTETDSEELLRAEPMQSYEQQAHTVQVQQTRS